MARYPISPESAHPASALGVFRIFAPAVLYLEIRKPNGDLDIGSCFHIGDGYYVSARHVLENNEIVSLGRGDLVHQYWFDEQSGKHGSEPRYKPLKTQRASDLIYHPDDSVDVACFKIEDINSPIIQLRLSREARPLEEHVLDEVVLFGYPPIPFSTAPALVSSKAEVTSFIEHRVNGKQHYIISSMARGGFSGGTAIDRRYPFWALGVVTESLMEDHSSDKSSHAKTSFTELGYTALLTANAIVEMLDANTIIIEAVEKSKRGEPLYSVLDFLEC